MVVITLRVMHHTERDDYDIVAAPETLDGARYSWTTDPQRR